MPLLLLLLLCRDFVSWAAPCAFGTLIASHAVVWMMDQVGAGRAPYLLLDYSPSAPVTALSRRCLGLATDAVGRATTAAAAATLAPFAGELVSGTCVWVGGGEGRSVRLCNHPYLPACVCVCVCGSWARVPWYAWALRAPVCPPS
jgi:hypothetical protein